MTVAENTRPIITQRRRDSLACAVARAASIERVAQYIATFPRGLLRQAKDFRTVFLEFT